MSWKKEDIKKIFMILFAFIVINATYGAVTTPAIEGDSLAYHIPIAEMIAKGDFLKPEKYSHLNYYPGSAEAILSLFYITKLPLNLFNVLAMLLLFFSSKILGREFGMNDLYSTVFAVTISSLHIITRWLNSQVIDIWLALFFILSLILIRKPKSSYSYFLKLGIALGFLFGVKYTGPFYVFFLILIFGKRLLEFFDRKNILIFSIPFGMIGLSWYLRNMLIIGNPVYPQPLFLLEGKPGWEIFTTATWEIIIKHPIQMFNAIFGEYIIWTLSLITPVIILLNNNFRLHKNKELYQIITLGAMSFILYLFLYTSDNYQIMVSSLRYSIPAFICFILASFLIADQYKIKKIVIFMSFLNILPVLNFSYHPKLILLLIPLVYWFYQKDLNKSVINDL